MGGLPSAPADAPFAHLAHAPVRDTTAAATAGQSFPEQDGFEISLQDMGGLLHLSLLCPHASSMLAAVLDWGRRWGSKEPGFTWRWNERSAVGVVPLDILSTLPRCVGVGILSIFLSVACKVRLMVGIGNPIEWNDDA
eukprot:1136608-Pelagomonas_calceolata.AAC.1